MKTLNETLGMKTLILDIETAPNIAYVWRFFKENISPKQVKENSTLLSYAAKWLGSDEIMYNDCRGTLDETFLTYELADLLDEADVVVAHNGDRFDLPKINTAILRSGEGIPPSPYRTIDTLKVAKKQFKFDSNRLEHIADHLELPRKKLAHKKYPGFELWLECLRNNEEAWEEMKEYNINDILVLEDLYLRFRPWVKNHPNAGLYTNEHKLVCPKCGGHHVQRRGYAYTNAGKYIKYQCNDCGGWGRTRYSELSVDKRKTLGTNA